MNCTMNIVQRIKNIYAALALLLALYTFLFQSIFSYNFSVEVNTHYFIYTSATVIFLLFIILLSFSKQAISLNRIDLILAVFLIVGLFHILFDGAAKIMHNEYYVALLISLMIYFLARFSAGWVIFYFLPFFVSIFFLYEIYLGIKQLVVFESDAKKMSLAITGSLENSGIYSIYVCASLPLFIYSVHVCSQANKNIRAAIVWSSVSLIGIILFHTLSRTGILMLVLFFLYRYSKLIKTKLLSKTRQRFFISVALCIFILAVIGWLYFLKPGSSSGRLFILGVIRSYVFDNFLWGIGIGNFSYQYPLWQIDYVASDSIEYTKLLYIDETKVAYNEFIQIFAETGIIGFSIYGFLLYSLFRSTPNDNDNMSVALKTTLTLILFSAATSYPFHCNSILFLFILCSASLLAKNQSYLHNTYTSHYSSYFILRLSALAILISLNSLFSFHQYKVVKQWCDLRNNYFITSAEKVQQYDSMLPKLSTSGKFLLDYGEYLLSTGDYVKSSEIIERSKAFYISERTYIAATEAYEHSENLKMAIENAQNWSLLVPYKFTPKEELAKLYLLNSDTAKAKIVASIILQMPVKIPSPKVNAIKQKMTNLLDEK